jgi:uncharacterized repeat protein (TIGR03803 family)
VTALANTNCDLSGGGVTLSADGSTLYGATNSGTIFSVPTTGGSVTTLASFNGASLVGSLTLSGSTLYGTADQSIFSLPATGGAITTLATIGNTSEFGSYDSFGSFTANKRVIGFGLRGSLLVTDTTIFGTTMDGSTMMGNGPGSAIPNGGTVFSLPISGGDTTVLGYFDRSPGGGELPAARLAISGSTLYGTTFEGGDNGPDGTLFSLSTTGGNITTLFSFGFPDGRQPVSGVTVSPDGSTLYGVTMYGGDSNKGTVYSFSVPPANSTAAVPETSTWVMGAMVTVGFGAMLLFRGHKKKAGSNS